MPTEVALAVGTRSVSFSFSKRDDEQSPDARRPPRCSSMETMRPTPWAG